MNKQIIVTLDKDGVLSPFLQTCVFALHQKNEAHWHRVESFEMNSRLLNAMAIREAVSAVAEKYQNCRIIISLMISGIAYQMLHKAGFFIFEADEISGELLDTVLGDVMNSRAEPHLVPMEPQSPNGDGHFVFDLIRLQKAYPEVSSKKALMAFITAADFLTLELICDHLPPWLEELVKVRGYRYNRKSENPGALRYLIQKI